MHNVWTIRRGIALRDTSYSIAQGEATTNLLDR